MEQLKVQIEVNMKNGWFSEITSNKIDVQFKCVLLLFHFATGLHICETIGIEVYRICFTIST